MIRSHFSDIVHDYIVVCTIYKTSWRALSVYTDASRRRAAFYTDKARLTSFVNGFKIVSSLVLSIK